MKVTMKSLITVILTLFLTQLYAQHEPGCVILKKDTMWGKISYNHRDPNPVFIVYTPDGIYRRHKGYTADEINYFISGDKVYKACDIGVQIKFKSRVVNRIFARAIVRGNVSLWYAINDGIHYIISYNGKDELLVAKDISHQLNRIAGKLGVANRLTPATKERYIEGNTYTRQDLVAFVNAVNRQ